MHYKIHHQKLKQLIQQRCLLLWVMVGLFLVCCSQEIVIGHLTNTRKIYFTPLPPVLTEPFFMNRDRISSGYLADMSRYFAMLRLNYTPASFPEQIKLLLRYTDGRFYGALKQQLLKEEQQAKLHDISLSFMPVDVQVFDKTLTVLIDGDLIRTVGQVSLPAERVTYRITYFYQDGVLKVTSFVRMRSQKNKNSEVSVIRIGKN